jgi:phosphate-selective porin OprO/OprP
MERSYVNQLAPAKKIGVMAFGEPRAGFTYAGSVFAMNDVEQDAKNDKASYAGRATLNFAEIMGNKDMVMHVGLAGFDSTYNITPSNSSATGGSTTQGTFLSYRTPGRGLSNIFRAQIGGQAFPQIATAPVSSNAGLADPSNATSQIKSQALGLEAILAYNNFKLQGEFAKADYIAKTGTGALIGDASTESFSLDTQAWYAEALWLATGEKYSGAYKAGTFGSIKPTNDFDPDNGKWGAWEFGLKYEEYKVDNMRAAGTVAAGSRIQGTNSCQVGGTAGSSISSLDSLAACESKASTYTAGIKWILNPNARILANASRTTFGNAWEHFDLDDVKLMRHEDIVMVRTQFAF